jgi:hypothetical protein
MNPRARQREVLMLDIGDELAVYDQDRRRLHVLNRTAALVWRHCDGQRTMVDLAALVRRELDIPADEHLVWLALARLQRAHLLEGGVTPPPALANISRRELARRAARTAAAAVLLPTVTSVLAPTAAHAQSPSPCAASRQDVLSDAAVHIR